jgi:carbon storage regulator
MPAPDRHTVRMLNITRRRGERIVVGDDVFVSVIEVSGQIVRLGIEAPRSVRVYREELWLEIKAQNEAVVQAAAATALPEGAVPELRRPSPAEDASSPTPAPADPAPADSPPAAPSPADPPPADTR